MPGLEKPLCLVCIYSVPRVQWQEVEKSLVILQHTCELSWATLGVYASLATNTHTQTPSRVCVCVYFSHILGHEQIYKFPMNHSIAVTFSSQWREWQVGK